MRARNITINLLAALALSPAAAFCAAAALGQSVALNKLITPNGDGRNDTFIFRCHNPRDSAVEAKIFDLSGRETAPMRLRGTSGFFYDFEWNPNSGGHNPGGIYVYQVRVETKVYKGSIVVIR